jgi:hypothetical protein
MLPLIVVFTALVFAATRYSDLPVGRALHAMLIAGPTAWLMKTPSRRIVIILVLLIGVALAWIEIAPLLMATDLAPVLWFADLTLYLDALLLVAVAFASAQIRSIGRLFSGGLRRARGVLPVRPRARARSSAPRRPKRPPPANDDAPCASILIAA